MTNNQGMKIAITGANSAVGQAILRWELQRRSTNTIVAAVRSARAVQQIQGLLNSLGGTSSAAQISYDDAGTLNAALSGASAVIHLAGILVERPGSSYEQANVVSTRSVVDAARHNSVRKIVLISAIGADEKSRNRYYRTKGEAEAIVRNSGICYTILRAPLLLGPGTEGSAALARNSRGDTAKLIAGGHHLQQPLHVADLAHGGDCGGGRLRCKQLHSGFCRACFAPGAGTCRTRSPAAGPRNNKLALFPNDFFRSCWALVNFSVPPDFPVMPWK